MSNLLLHKLEQISGPLKRMFKWLEMYHTQPWNMWAKKAKIRNLENKIFLSIDTVLSAEKHTEQRRKTRKHALHLREFKMSNASALPCK